METYKASIVHIEEKVFILMKVDDEDIRIPMCEDRPIDVKNAFNKMIRRLKKGAFAIELDKVGEDLFSQVANEYLTQLSREIQEVHGEMQHAGLTAE